MFQKQLQALRDSSQTRTGAIDQQTQGFVQAIQDQTRAIRESKQVLLINFLQKSIEKGIQEYDEITNVIFNLLQILLIQIKLILVSLRQFLICLMTRTKVSLV